MTDLPFSGTTPISVSRVGLRARDAESLASYYKNLLGFEELSRSGGDITLGAAGRTLLVLEAALTLPEASTALAVKAWLPSESAAVSNVHAPLPLAVTVPILVAPSNTCTVLPAVAVPLRVNVLSLVTPSPTTPLSVENEATVGARGAATVVADAMIITESEAPLALTLPAASMDLAVNEWLPLVRVAVAKDHLPALSATAVPI